MKTDGGSRAVNIYTIDAAYAAGNTVYKDVVPEGYRNWYHESRAQILHGEPLRTAWVVDSTSKIAADWIPMPSFGVPAKADLADELKRYAPDGAIIPFTINGEVEKFALLKPKNYAEDEKNLDHIFMMFTAYKHVLVTEQFKSAWQKRGLTGAEFEFVTDFSSDRFTPVSE
jgi:hypothetical protein